MRECRDGQCGFRDGQDREQPRDQNTLQPGSYREAGSVNLGPGQILHGTRWKVKQIPELFDDLNFEPPPWILKLLGHPTQEPDNRQGSLTSEDETVLVPRLPQITLKHQDITRWQWACGAPLGARERHWLKIRRHWSYKRIVLQESNIWPRLVSFESPGLALSFSFASATYGALHALAWSAASPSKAETTLWRVAVCVPTGGLPLFLFLYCWTCPRIKTRHHGCLYRGLFGLLTGRALIYVERRLDAVEWRLGPVKWRLDAVKGILSQVISNKRIVRSMSLIYFLARIYLVVECFVNLFHLPAAVFQVPNWSVYFPHIS